MGYTKKEDIRSLLISFVKLFPIGDPLPSRDSPVTNEEFLNFSYIRKPKISPEFNTILHNLKEIRLLRYGNDKRPYSMIYNLPRYMLITSNEISAKDFQHQRQLELPLCTTGDMPGRWVYEPTCDKYDQDWGTGKYADVGSECTHSSTVYFYAEIKDRARSMVWRPYKCRLAHHAICSKDDNNCILQNKFKEEQYDTQRNTYSSLLHCMKSKGIGFIAGFGDSLGDEQYRNIVSLLGLNGKTGRRFRGYSIECRGGSGEVTISFKNIHRMSVVGKLTTCVEDTVKKIPSVMSNISTVVLVTNFMASHLLSGVEDMAEIIDLLKKQSIIHTDLARKLLLKKIKYRRIFFSGTALHGFRNAGLTASRMIQLNNHARHILGSSGWEILDAYNITLGRPDGTTDGLHYRGGVSIAISDVLTTMICNM
jgi:hypothetical protein